MAKKNGSGSADELKLLHDWYMIFVRYLGTLAGSSEKSPLSFLELTILENYKQGNLKNFKSIKSELLQWAKGFTPKQQRELDELLRSETGRGLKEEQRLFEQHVNAIIKRGRIKNADEARLLEERVEEIYTDEQKKGELEKINRLLTAYAGKFQRHNT